MTDYRFYIYAAYGLTIAVLGLILIVTLWQGKDGA